MKRVILYVLPVVIISFLTTLQACDDENETPVLEIPSTTISLKAEQTSQTFTLKSNVGWVISSDSKWCTVSPEYGSGSKEITITLDGENKDTSEARTAILTIKSGQTDTKTIDIIQEAAVDDRKKPEAKEYIFNTVDNGTNNKYGVWLYFSFEKGEVIGSDIGSLANDEEWKNRTDWDIAFTRFYARTNSGKSGIGSGGVIEKGENNDDKEEVFKSIIEAPEAGYIVDDIVEKMMINMPPMGANLYNSGGSAELNKWLDNTDNPPIVKPKVFVVKTADGKYAKIYLKAYNDGIITMYYAYQPDGSTNLEMAE